MYAIKAIALFLINAVRVADHGIAMAELTVVTARRKQAADIAEEMQGYKKKAVARSALARVKADEEIIAFVQDNPVRQRLYNEAQQDIAKAIDKAWADIDNNDIEEAA